MPKRTNVAFLLVLLASLFAPFLFAAESPAPGGTDTVRFIWLIEESVDGELQPTPLTPILWKKKLAPLGFENVNQDKVADILARCPIASFLSATPCEALGPELADIALIGTVKIETQKTGQPEPKNLGARIAITLKGIRIDNNQGIFDLTQASYGVGADTVDAFSEGLRKVAKPISMRIEPPIRAALAQMGEGRLSVSGSRQNGDFDDLLMGLRGVRGVRSIQLVEAKAESAEYNLAYSGVFWGTLVDRIRRTQGSGVLITKVGKAVAEGRYDDARAFRMVIAVATPVDQATGKPLGGKEEELATVIEAAFSATPGVNVVQFPTRLPAKPAKALAEMKTQYGGDLVILPLVSKSGEQLLLTAEVQAVFLGGKALSLIALFNPQDMVVAAKELAAELARQLPELLDKNVKKFSKDRQRCYEAWKKEQGG